VDRLLSIKIVEYPDPFVVQLSGEIDLVNDQEVIDLGDHPHNAHGVVEVDISGVTFMGSAAIQALLIVAATAENFRVRHPRTIASQLLRIAGLDAWMQDP
jgi:anti-anti-sigma factor